MKLSSGSIIINKRVSDVFVYARDQSKFDEQMEICGLDDYELETDDDLEGLLDEGDEFSIYAFAKYEEDKDFVMDLEILKVSPNNYFTFRISRMAVYENEDDEYDDAKPLPTAFIWEQIEIGVLFSDLSGKTEVKIITYVKPSASLIFKSFAWLANAVGYFENKRILKQWGAIVEKHA
jgi:hypothetical protein